MVHWGAFVMAPVRQTLFDQLAPQQSQPSVEPPACGGPFEVQPADDQCLQVLLEMIGKDVELETLLEDSELLPQTRLDACPPSIIERVAEEEERVDPVDCSQRERSEEHTSELQSRENLVCRLLLEKKKKKE